VIQVRRSSLIGPDTHYFSGDEIQAGDRVTCAAWTGRVCFVVVSDDYAPGYTPADWAYLGRGFMIDYEQVGLVFSEEADEDLMLLERG
jgi:hypothetical protein